MFRFLSVCAALFCLSVSCSPLSVCAYVAYSYPDPLFNRDHFGLGGCAFNKTDTINFGNAIANAGYIVPSPYDATSPLVTNWNVTTTIDSLNSATFTITNPLPHDTVGSYAGTANGCTLTDQLLPTYFYVALSVNTTDLKTKCTANQEPIAGQSLAFQSWATVQGATGIFLGRFSGEPGDYYLLKIGGSATITVGHQFTVTYKDTTVDIANCLDLFNNRRDMYFSFMNPNAAFDGKGYTHAWCPIQNTPAPAHA